MTRPITIKTALTAEELRVVADTFLEFWDAGNRPHIWTPSLIEPMVEKVREVRRVEKGLA